MFNGKIHYKWSFSIAMLNYQRVNLGLLLNYIELLLYQQHLTIQWLGESVLGAHYSMLEPSSYLEFPNHMIAGSEEACVWKHQIM